MCRAACLSLCLSLLRRHNLHGSRPPRIYRCKFKLHWYVPTTHAHQLHVTALLRAIYAVARRTPLPLIVSIMQCVVSHISASVGSFVMDPPTDLTRYGFDTPASRGLAPHPRPHRAFASAHQAAWRAWPHACSSQTPRSTRARPKAPSGRRRRTCTRGGGRSALRLPIITRGCPSSLEGARHHWRLIITGGGSSLEGAHHHSRVTIITRG